MANVLDANLFIRYFTNDDPKKAQAVKHLLETKKDLIIPDMVFAEIEWTLRSFFKQPKEQILTNLASILTLNNVVMNASLIAKTLLIWQQYSINFIEAYLAAYVKENQLEGIYSCDKADFDKIKDLHRLEP